MGILHLIEAVRHLRFSDQPEAVIEFSENDKYSVEKLYARYLLRYKEKVGLLHGKINYVFAFLIKYIAPIIILGIFILGLISYTSHMPLLCP